MLSCVRDNDAIQSQCAPPSHEPNGAELENVESFFCLSAEAMLFVCPRRLTLVFHDQFIIII